jgi:hypothetical protein
LPVGLVLAGWGAAAAGGGQGAWGRRYPRCPDPVMDGRALHDPAGLRARQALARRPARVNRKSLRRPGRLVNHVRSSTASLSAADRSSGRTASPAGRAGRGRTLRPLSMHSLFPPISHLLCTPFPPIIRAMSTPDFLVIGGGIIGCSLARELARTSRRVCVVDGRTAGSAASSAAAGLLSPALATAPAGPLLDLCSWSARPPWRRSGTPRPTVPLARGSMEGRGRARVASR